MKATNEHPYILHICMPEDWLAAKTEDEYKPASFSKDGYIHCSSPRQILKVANTYYHDAAGLILLWIDTAKLRAPLKWEESDIELFPHIYGALNLEAIEAVYDFRPDSDKIFRNIPGLADHG